MTLLLTIRQPIFDLSRTELTSDGSASIGYLDKSTVGFSIAPPIRLVGFDALKNWERFDAEYWHRLGARHSVDFR